MAPPRRGVVASLVLMLVACAPRAAPVTPAAGDPMPSCREAWVDIPSALRNYDFARDAMPTERGNEGYRSYAEHLGRRACQKEWTVLLYMAADAEDLRPHAYWQIHEIESALTAGGGSAGSTVDADIVAQLDLDIPDGVRRLHLFGGITPGEPERPPPSSFATQTPRGIRSPVVEFVNEEGGPPGEIFERFLRWGIEAYPARHYWVIVWGHGRGWRPRVTGAGTPLPYDRDIRTSGLAQDFGQGTVLDVPSLREALQRAAGAGLGGRPFDVFAADACLMQSVEVAAELAGVARYAVGSEQIESYLGLPYRELLPHLNGMSPPPPGEGCAPRDAGCALARFVPDEELRSVAPGGPYAAVAPNAGEHLTASTLDLDRVTIELLPALRRLSAALAAWIDEEPLRRVTLADVLVPPRGPGLGATLRTPDFQGGMRDIGVLLSRLRATLVDETRSTTGRPTPPARALDTAISEAQDALRHSVPASAFGTRYQEMEYAMIAGVSVWVPATPEEYRARVDFFSPARIYAEPAADRRAVEQGWRTWIDRVFGGDAAHP